MVGHPGQQDQEEAQRRSPIRRAKKEQPQDAEHNHGQLGKFPGGVVRVVKRSGCALVVPGDSGGDVGDQHCYQADAQSDISPTIAFAENERPAEQ